LIESIQQAEVDDKAQALEAYREILARNAAPEPGDPVALRAAMATLGIDAGRLHVDLAALTKAAELEAAAAANTPELIAAMNAAYAKFTAYQAETRRIADERDAEGARLFTAASQLRDRQNAASIAVGTLKTLRQRHWELFDEPKPMPKAAEPDGMTFSTHDPLSS
jgi:hypothetical protein